MTTVSPYLSIITVKCVETKFSNKKTEWLNVLEKGRTNYMLREAHFSFKDTHRVKVKTWEKIFNASGNQKREG